MKNCLPRAKPAMLQDCGTEGNVASAVEKAIGCSSTEVRRRCDKKSRSGGKAIVRCSSSVGLPFAGIPHTEKFSCCDAGQANDCRPRALPDAMRPRAGCSAPAYSPGSAGWSSTRGPDRTSILAEHRAKRSAHYAGDAFFKPWFCF